MGAGADEVRGLSTSLKSLGYAATLQGDTLVLSPEAVQ
jgi:hypothetical protein